MLASLGADMHSGTCHCYKEKVWEEAEFECANSFGINLDGEWRPARQQRGRVPGWGACSAGLWGVGARCGQIAHSRCSENAHRKGFVETIQKC